MREIIAGKVLDMIISENSNVQIKVSGNSMEPTLKDNDIISVERHSDYDIGDIIVFSYKMGETLVHRLLKKDLRYYCKGDNSFRLEDISKENIIGKVVSVNKMPIEPWLTWEIELSYLVNRTFRDYGYSIEKTKQSNIYKLYDAIILNRNVILQKDIAYDNTLTSKTLFLISPVYKSQLISFNMFEQKLIGILCKPSTIQDLISKLKKEDDLIIDIYNEIGRFLSYAVSNNIVLPISI